MMTMEKNCCKVELEVPNAMGLHARPATSLVQCASAFKSDISINKDGELVDGKSILGLMMLSAGRGSRLVITAEGEDAEAALDAIRKLFECKFGEE